MSQAQHEANKTELAILDAARKQYEAEGYTFEVSPSPRGLPAFFGQYVPDAIARKAGRNVAIEVRRSRNRANEFTVRMIRSRFEGRSDWKFVVVYAADDPLNSLTIRAAEMPAIRHQLNEIRSLAAQGHHRAAFVLGWSLLEAALLSFEEGDEARPRTPGSVLQGLAMLGRVEPETERRLRPLILLRNAVVHGDLSVTPSDADVTFLLSVIEDAISEV